MSVICPSCGFYNVLEATFCEDCGSRLQTRAIPVPRFPETPPQPAQPARIRRTVTCPACDRENYDDEVYCAECGASLKTTSRSIIQPIPEPPTSRAPARPAPPRAVPGVFLVEEDTGREFAAKRAELLIGRGGSAEGIDVDLSPTDPQGTVSRKHARIVFSDNVFVIEDLGSANGTFVNNVRLTSGIRVPLKNGDRVRFGKLYFRFRS